MKKCSLVAQKIPQPQVMGVSRSKYTKNGAQVSQFLGKMRNLKKINFRTFFSDSQVQELGFLRIFRKSLFSTQNHTFEVIYRLQNDFFGEINFQTFFIPQRPTELVFYISEVFYISDIFFIKSYIAKSTFNFWIFSIFTSISLRISLGKCW